MIRTVVIALFLFGPAPAAAQSVRAISGEHADFSRIVLQFADLDSWKFGRTPDGYEFRATNSNVEFDLSRVFDFIPRTRVASLTSPGPGRLVFSVNCDCVGDAFEIRDARIVIDIKDGLPTENSRFENPIGSDVRAPDTAPEQPYQSAEPLDAANTGPDWAAFGTPLINEDPENPQPPLPDDPMEIGDLNLDENLSNNRGEPSSIFVELVGELSVKPHIPGTIDGDDTASNSGNNAVPETRPSPSAMSRVDPEISNPKPPIIARPIFPVVPMTFANETPLQSQLLETALLEQLSRAAAQGLVALPDVDISQAIPIPIVPTNIVPETSRQIGNTEPTQQVSNFRMETSADRDRIQQPAQNLTTVGNVCIENSVFDFPAWGEPDAFKSPFDKLRTGIVGEFDTPDTQAILALARRYLYLGFGVETKSLLANFEVDIPNSDLLLQLSEIVDDGFANTPGRLFGQISCKTNAAMWATLAHQKIPAGVQVDRENLLRTFSALPVHLRHHLGPGLAQRFLDKGDTDIAASIQKLMDRASAQHQPGAHFTQANIASQTGDVAEQLAQLNATVAAKGPYSATALAQFIETKLAQGLPVSEKSALLASATAVEYRDSDIGRRLTRAAIRSFALNGQIEPTLERVSDAKLNGYITNEEALELSTETLLRNAQISPDGEFLLVFFRHQEKFGAVTENEKVTRQITADRLVKLGFPDSALELYSVESPAMDDGDRMVVAAAQIERSETQKARAYLIDSRYESAQKLIARSFELDGNFSLAAGIYHDLGMEREFQDASWLAGNWSDIALDVVPLRAEIASLIQAEFPEIENMDDPSSQGGLQKNAITKGASIARAKELVATSVRTRRVLESILEASK